jgi:aldehyde decarbonylase
MLCVQYLSNKDGGVSRLIEKAVSDAEASGARVLTLGLLNQVHHLSLFKCTSIAFLAY